MNIGSPSEHTDFSIDVLGRYTCNTFEEALASSDPVFRAGARDLNNNPLPAREDVRSFDFIIIGGGTFGASIAEQLWFRSAERSERILVLEAGPFVLPEHQQNLPSFGLDAGREVWGKSWNASSTLEFPGLAFCLGGRSLWWGGWSPRLLNEEMPTAASPQTPYPWPTKTVDELNAQTLPNGHQGYFRQSSQQIGVSATNDYIFGDLHNALRKQLFDGIKAGAVSGALDPGLLPDAPTVEILETTPSLTELAAMLGVDLPSPMPTGATALNQLEQELRNQLKLEAPLAVQARPEHAGFFPINKFSTVPLLIKTARSAYKNSAGDDVKKRLMIVPRCHVTRLSLDGNRINAILTERGPVPVAPDAKVIIALGAIESARLALLSFGDDGRIGRNLMAHLRSDMTIRVPREALLTLPSTVKALQTSALLVKGRHHHADGTFGYFHLQITASGLGPTGTNSEAELFQKVPDIEFVNQHLRASDTHVVITIRAIGEMEPNNPNSHVTLDLNPSQVDFGERRAYVSLQASSKDMQLWHAMDTATDDVAHLFGGGFEIEIFTPQGIKKAATRTGVSPGDDLSSKLLYTPKGEGDPAIRGRRDNLGSTHHEAGTLRMGNDPASSVTDANCRFHGIQNAYAVGPALFPTIGSPNPMLTGVALARRLGDHLLPPPNPWVSEAGFRPLFEGSESTEVIFDKWLMAGGGQFKKVGRTLVAQPLGEMGVLYFADEQFDNFTLRLEFCLPHPRGNFNDNSGIFVRFRDPRKPLLPGTPRTESSSNAAMVAVDTGYEIQLDEEARGDRRIGEADGAPFNRTGAIYKIKNLGTLPGQQNYTNHQRLSAGAWHTLEIKVTDRTYQVLLNGQPSTTFSADPTDPQESFRGRKRSEDPNSGFIGLQVHTGTVAFANIRINT